MYKRGLVFFAINQISRICPNQPYQKHEEHSIRHSKVVRPPKPDRQTLQPLALLGQLTEFEALNLAGRRLGQ